MNLTWYLSILMAVSRKVVDAKVTISVTTTTTTTTTTTMPG